MGGDSAAGPRSCAAGALKMRASSGSAFAPRQRFVARRIVATTQRLVRLAMARQWHGMRALMVQRQALLDELGPLSGDTDAARCAQAVCAAVRESDRLLDRLMTDGADRHRD